MFRKHISLHVCLSAASCAVILMLAVALAAVNVFGGFLVTQRMLEMFRKKEPKAVKSAEAAPALAKEGAK